MNVDYIGSQSVAQLIEMTGLTKFIISRVGQHKNVVPVYEHIVSGSNDKAVNSFVRWSQLTNNSLPYEMALFNSVEDSELSGEEVRNKKQGKILRFTFCLNEEKSFQEKQGQQQNVDVAMIVENALMKMQNAHNESALMKKLTELEQKIADYESEEEEEGDDLNQLSGSNNMTAILGLLANALGSGPAKPTTTINGLNPDQIGNIQRAIKTLSKYDDQIDTDLLKLSSIAETNPTTFKMLLNTLRSM